MSYQMPQEVKSFVQKEMKRYEEDKRMAILPCLFRLQGENRGDGKTLGQSWITEDMISSLSEEMDIAVSKIQEVFRFYTMYNKKPVGKCHVELCTNVSCFLRGAGELFSHLCHKYKVSEGEVTPDGQFSFSQVECLGACDGAPMMQVGDRYYENLNPRKLEQILEGLKEDG